ncbi:MAG: hypothetical protein IH851_06045 [Armatimonadetes bacterium]|nr:hypothetical protein [Armatimonadota bacterium]
MLPSSVSVEDGPDGPCLFSSFAALPSNRTALELVTAFAAGRVPLAFVQGPAGWGKTHLLRLAARAVGGRLGTPVRLISSLSISKPVSSIEREGALIVDDLHLAAGQPRVRQHLLMTLERRARARRPTLCACLTGGCGAPRRLLPLPREWRHATLEEPSPEERVEVLNALGRTAGVSLSEAAARLICRLVRGDGRSLYGAITRLRVAAGQDLSGICPLRVAGLLNPYLQDERGIDLRDIVEDAVSRSLGSRLRRSEPEIPRTLAVYVMRRVMGLAERSVAAYYGLPPARVFRIERRAEQALGRGERTLRDGLERVVCHIERRLDEF